MGALVGVVLLLASAAGEDGRGERPRAAQTRRAFFALSPAVYVGTGLPPQTGLLLGGEVAASVQVEFGRAALRFSLPLRFAAGGVGESSPLTTVFSTGLGVEASVGLVLGFSLTAGTVGELWFTTVRGGYFMLLPAVVPTVGLAWRSGRHEVAVKAHLAIVPLAAVTPFFIGPRYTIFF